MISGIGLSYIAPYIRDRWTTDSVSLTTYATAVALYIDRKLARSPQRQDSVLTFEAVQGGELHVVKVLPFIRNTTKLL
jgi:hypothetical protein